MKAQQVPPLRLLPDAQNAPRPAAIRVRPSGWVRRNSAVWPPSSPARSDMPVMAAKKAPPSPKMLPHSVP